MATAVLLAAGSATLTPAVQQACGPPAQAHDACLATYRLFHSAAVARLADVVVTKPLKILLILVVALLVHLLARRAIKRFVAGMRTGTTRLGRLRRPMVMEGPAPTPRAVQRAETIGSLLNSVVGFVIWAVAIVTILGEFGVNLGPLLAGAGVVGVAIGFGAQSLVKDFLTGMFMLVEDQYGVGDTVDTGFATGVVEGISLRATRLRDETGTVWYIPHSSIQRIANKSQGGGAVAPPPDP